MTKRCHNPRRCQRDKHFSALSNGAEAAPCGQIPELRGRSNSTRCVLHREKFFAIGTEADAPDGIRVLEYR